MLFMEGFSVVCESKDIVINRFEIHDSLIMVSHETLNMHSL